MTRATRYGGGKPATPLPQDCIAQVDEAVRAFQQPQVVPRLGVLRGVGLRLDRRVVAPWRQRVDARAPVILAEQRLSWQWVLGKDAVGVAIVALVALTADPALQNIIILALIYSVVAHGVNFVVGNLRLPHLGIGAFVGCGAYVCAMLVTLSGFNWWEASLCALGAAATLSIPVGLLVLRTRGLFFLMASFAVGELAYNAVYAAPGMTGGDTGIAGVARPVISGLTLNSETAFMWAAFVVFALVLILVEVIDRSPLGTSFRSIGQNEQFMEARGYNVKRLMLVAFGLSSVLAALGGLMLVFYYQSITPGQITLSASGVFFLVVLLGGVNSVWGPVLGAAVVSYISSDFTSPPSISVFVLGILLILVAMTGGRGFVGILRMVVNRWTMH